MMKILKPSYLKLGIALLVFVALFASYQVPIVSAQKFIQVISLGISIFLMLIIMRNPMESSKRWLNLFLIALLSASLLAYAFI